MDVQSIYDNAALFASSTSKSLNSISDPSMFCRAIKNFGVYPRCKWRCDKMFRTCVDRSDDSAGSRVWGFSPSEEIFRSRSLYRVLTVPRSISLISSTPNRSLRTCGDALAPIQRQVNSSLSRSQLKIMKNLYKDIEEP